jgi:hypothetical protein
MKPDEVSAAAKSIPMPTMTGPEGDQWQRQSVINVVTGHFENYGSAEDNAERFAHALDALSGEDLMKLRDIGNHLHDMLHSRSMRISKNVRYIEQYVYDGDIEAIDFFHRYREQTIDQYSFERMDVTRAALRELGIHNPESGEQPATMEAHIRGALFYVPLPFDGDTEDEDEYGRFAVYSEEERLVHYVERHPDRVDDIMKFRRERSDSTFDDMEEFFKAADDSKAKAVKEGWL